MSQFKVGDRVAVYAEHRIVGVIDVVVNAERVCIRSDEQVGFFVHPKQCRRLIKKPRRRIWVAPDEFNNGARYANCVKERPVLDNFIEFIEAWKRK